jgi:hypothetical protein
MSRKLLFPILYIDEDKLRDLANKDQIFNYSLNYDVIPGWKSGCFIIRIIASWPSIDGESLVSRIQTLQFEDKLDVGQAFKEAFLQCLKDLRAVLYGTYDSPIPLYDGPPRKEKIKGDNFDAQNKRVNFF